MAIGLHLQKETSMNSQSNLLTIEEASKLLNLKLSWLRKPVARRQIPYVKLNHLIRFDRIELEAWLEQRKRG